jgi:TolA-binding protein
MNAALQLAHQYDAPADYTAEARFAKERLPNNVTVLNEMSPEQLLQKQLSELQSVIADLRGKLALAQRDLSQKETLLHTRLQRELELRVALKGTCCH